MRILFVITGLGVGGAERQVVDLAGRLAGEGHVVEIAYLTGEAVLRPTDDAVRITGFGISRSIGGYLRAHGELRRLVRSFRPDVVHSHMVHANLLARIVRLTVNMPRLICTAHSSNEGGWIRMCAYRLTDCLADTSTNVSYAAVAAFEAQGAVRRGRMLAVVNGIDTERFCSHSEASARQALRDGAGIRPGDRLILAVGRLAEEKGYPGLLEAFARVRNDRKGDERSVRLWIAGGGGSLAGLTQMAGDLGIRECVDFLGVRSDVPGLLDAADVFVLSSTWEGLPLVVGEAMASEKVVVATDCGGVGELLGECGYLVPPRDSSALAAALVQALEMPPADALAMGVRARQRIVSHFSLESAVEKWLSIYSGQDPGGRTGSMAKGKE